MERIINIQVEGNTAVKDSDCAGTQYEANSTLLKIRFSEEWYNLAKTVTFWNAHGHNPVEITLTENLSIDSEDSDGSVRIYEVPIPPEAMTEYGEMSFVIDGYTEEKGEDGEIISKTRSRTAEVSLKVRPSRKMENAYRQDPTPTQAEQLQTQIDQIIGTISAAKDAAAGSAKAAATSAEKASGSEGSASIFSSQASDSAIAAAEDAGAAAKSAEAAAKSAGAAAKSALEASGYVGTTSIYVSYAQDYADAAAKSAEEAETSALKASGSEGNASIFSSQANDCAEAAESSAIRADYKAELAKTFCQEAEEARDAAATSATNASNALKQVHQQAEEIQEDVGSLLNVQMYELWDGINSIAVKKYDNFATAYILDFYRPLGTNESIEGVDLGGKSFFTLYGDGEKSVYTIDVTDYEDVTRLFVDIKESANHVIVKRIIFPTLEQMEEMRSSVVGKKGSPESIEIFNDYENNKSNIPNAHVEGKNNSATVKCFLIRAFTTNTVTLDSVEGIEVGMPWRICPAEGYPNKETPTPGIFGTIKSISGNVVTIDSGSLDTEDFVPAEDPSFVGTFIVNGGTIGLHTIEDEENTNFTTHAEGIDNIASLGSHAEGSKVKALGFASHAEGRKTTTLGDNCHAEGILTTAKSHGSHAEGDGTVAAGKGAHSEGCTTNALAVAAHAEGERTVAKGIASHAEGSFRKYMKDNGDGTWSTVTELTTASGYGSHAEGEGTKASGEASHAEGVETKATQLAAHAEGHKTEATGHYAHAEGEETTASELDSHAEGYKTTASGVASHAEGLNSIASARNAHAEGEGTSASGQDSHAEGKKSTANGVSSHAEGESTVASGMASHAEGFATGANGKYSHTEGEGTYTNSERQHVQGKFNVIDSDNKFAHIVGNGTSNKERSNAYTLDWKGNAIYAGKVYAEGDKELATVEQIEEQGLWGGVIDLVPDNVYTVEEVLASPKVAKIPCAGTSQLMQYLVMFGHEVSPYNAVVTSYPGTAGDRTYAGGDYWQKIEFVSGGETYLRVGNTGDWYDWEKISAPVILTSSSGSGKKFQLQVDDNGNLTTAEV